MNLGIRDVGVFTIAVLLTALFSSCGNRDRQVMLERSVSIVYVDSSQDITTSDELAGFYTQNLSAYNKVFNDSTIFVSGYVRRVDEEHAEVILANNSGVTLVCVLKDTVALQYLRRSDRVLFKGVCKAVSGKNLILVGDCLVAQIRQ
jgi:predicted nucleotidyltransferase